jgi:hypothetical protein
MTIRQRRASWTLIAASVLCSCSSPVQSVTFKPPAGWAASPSLFGFQAWHPKDNKQALILFKLPAATDPNRALSESNFRQFSTSLRERIRICGNQPAIFLSGTGTGARGTQRLEMVMTSVGGATYLATYARDEDVRPNSEAETAIRSLCPRKAV